MVRKITEIEVIDAEKRRVPSKHYVYVILVTWSDGSVLTVFRRYSRFFDLQTRLLERFPIEGGSIDPNKREIPFLPGKIFFGRSQIKDVAMKRLKEINNYCKTLIKLRDKISQSDEVLEFFEIEPDDLDPPKAEKEEGKRKLSLSLSLTSISKLRSAKEMKAEKISKPKRLEVFVAVADYEVQQSGEIALYPGLRVEVLEKSESGWWFVNSEDEKGWVPSTYLEPEEGANPTAHKGALVEPGQEESYVCIESFKGASSDEIDLERGSVVQALQKNMDGWWLVRYQGQEGYAPGTYLKKAMNAHTKDLVQKSRLSGVEIISSLQDVSTLLNQEKNDTQKEKSPITKRKEDVVRPLAKETASAFVKQRSLERGGSLVPPPRQNSVTKVDAPQSSRKSNIYVTADDFSDSVGDGLSFKKGEMAQVIEKTPTGWWFVKIEDEEGWVPSSYLEKSTEQERESVYELAVCEEPNSDEEWYTQVTDEDIPSEETPPSRMTHKEMANRPLPAIPSEPEKEERSGSPRMAMRPLPAPPAPPAELSSKSEVPIPKFGKGSSVASANVKEKNNAEPTPSPVAGGGPSDLASVLKAKFEARAGSVGDSGASSDEEVKKSKGSKPPIPLVPTKPKEMSESAFPPVNGSSQKSTAVGSKCFSKPTPPAKNKPTLPGKPSGNRSDNTPSTPPKPAPPQASLKPVLKTEIKKSSDVSAAADGPVRNNVKSLTAAFGASVNLKPAPGQKPSVVKPAVSNKPKPVIASKPTVASKPKPISAPSINNNPQNEGVGSLVNKLSGKLNLNPQLSTQHEQNVNVECDSNIPSQQPASIPSNRISSMPAEKSSISSTFVAVYSFVAENEGEMSMNEGDEVEVLEDQGDWCLIRCWDEEGWVPMSYLEKV